VGAAPSTPVAAGPAGASGSGQTKQAAPASVVPFVRGSGLGRYKFFSQAGITLTANSQDLGPIDVKAYDFMRSILITVKATAAGVSGGACTLAPDGPFNFFTNMMVKQPNGQTMYQTSSGFHAAMIHKYGGYAGYNDPQDYPDFSYTAGASSLAPTMAFAVRIPFELNIRDALGSLPNKNAAAPFELDLTINTITNVWPSWTAGSSPTFTVECWLEAWDQPPTTLGGAPCQTVPPNVNTLQRWTEQNVTLSTGQFDARVRKLGNYIREIIFMGKNSSSVRAEANIWPDPVQVVLDEDVKDNISLAQWKRDIAEIWGYGRSLPVTAIQAATADFAHIAADTPGGLNLGVYPRSYAHEFDGRFGHENGDLYLPTIESEDYLLRGVWGSSASKLVCLVDEVLPQGNIFS
jgi:hypothetical protein